MPDLSVHPVLLVLFLALEQRLRERVRLRGEFKLLKTTPGIGETLATTIMLKMGTPERFAKVGNFSMPPGRSQRIATCLNRMGVWCDLLRN